MKTIIVLFATVTLLISACGVQKVHQAENPQDLVPLEQELVLKYDLDLSKVQIYISDELQLVRKRDSSFLVIRKDGSIQITEEAKPVRIPKFRKGVVIRQGHDDFDTKFRSDDDHFITFKVAQKGQYYINADRWVKKNGQVVYGEITYGGEVYIFPKDKGYTKALINKETLKRIEERVEPGVKVQQ